MDKRRKIKKHTESNNTVIYIAVAAAVMLIVFALLMGGFAALMCQADIPFSFVSTIATALLCISVFSAALAFAALTGSAGLLSGCIIGVAAFAIVFIAGAICHVTPSSFAFTKALSMVVSGGVGGFAGIILSEKRRRIR